MVRLHPFEIALREGLVTCGITVGETLLCAVSGGPDSMAMLTAMVNLRESSNEKIPEFVVAHFNHRLRGPESEGDARYVSDFCNEHEIICEIGTGDVADYAKSHPGGVELASRKMRYNFLRDAAQRHGASSIATAHTRDDQAETILLHIVRGSGLAGLRGIQQRGHVPGAEISDGLALVRPMLVVAKSETDAYCKAAGIRPRHDSSNDDLSFARNRIRHRVLPELRELNPSVAEALIRLGTAAGADHDALEAVVDDEWDVATHQHGAVILPLAVLNNAPLAIATRIIQRAYAEFGPDPRHTLETVHIQAILKATRGGGGSSIELPDGVVVAIEYENAMMIRGPKPIDYQYLPIDAPMTLDVPGNLDLAPVSTLFTSLTEPPVDTSSTPVSIAYLDAPTENMPLTVRNWIEGDRFQPLGMTGEKKLSDFFIDNKVPRDWRRRIPLVLIDDRIAWVAGYRIADWAKVTSDTNICIRLELTNPQES
ncbi:MAG: tRNA lysidine(34) synthetase TilS [Chloroflexi bacterium]|nr:tRNA lysidine(34) synthetase TilS [Chloroflexota bacterium]